MTSLSGTPEFLTILKHARDDGMTVSDGIRMMKERVEDSKTELSKAISASKSLLDDLMLDTDQAHTMAAEDRLQTLIVNIEKRLERLETEETMIKQAFCSGGQAMIPCSYKDPPMYAGTLTVFAERRKDGGVSAQPVEEESGRGATPVAASIPERVTHFEEHVRTLEDRLEVVESMLRKPVVDAYFASHGANMSVLRMIVQEFEQISQYAQNLAGQQRFSEQQQFGGAQTSHSDPQPEASGSGTQTSGSGGWALGAGEEAIGSSRHASGFRARASGTGYGGFQFGSSDDGFPWDESSSDEFPWDELLSDE